MMNNNKPNLFTIAMMILISLLFFVMIKWEADASNFSKDQVGSILEEWELWWNWTITIDDEIEQAYRDIRYCNSVTGKCHINYRLWNKTYKFPVHSEAFQMFIEESLMMTPYMEKKVLTPIQSTIYINVLLIKKWYKPIYNF